MKRLVILFFILIFSFPFISNNFSTSSTYYYPTDYTYITSEYGNRDLLGKNNFHNGIDFGAPFNSKIYATKSGVVTFCGFIQGYGNSIIIEHEDGFKSMYCHVGEQFIVNVGDFVNTSSHIANVGPLYLSNGIMNGITTGPHLHFTIYDKNGKTVNPKDFKYEKRTTSN